MCEIFLYSRSYLRSEDLQTAIADFEDDHHSGSSDGATSV